MNFYQRANLSLSLAVVFGFQVAILGQVAAGGLDALWTNTKPILSWIIFQIVFKCKVIFDDHVFFESEGFEASNYKWLHFLSLVSVNTLHAVAASTIYITNASLVLFGIGLAISSIWVAGDLTSKPKNDFSIPVWFGANLIIGCVALLWLVGFLGSVLAPMLMLLVVAFDFYKGGTWRTPPGVK